MCGQPLPRGPKAGDRVARQDGADVRRIVVGDRPDVRGVRQDEADRGICHGDVRRGGPDARQDDVDVRQDKLDVRRIVRIESLGAPFRLLSRARIA